MKKYPPSFKESIGLTFIDNSLMVTEFIEDK